MKGILLRMWYAIRIPVIILISVLLVLTVINPIYADMGITLLSSCIAALPFLLLLSDEKSRFARWQTILPVSRGRLVDAYYLLTLLLTAVGVLWSALIMLHYNKAEALLRIFQLTMICGLGGASIAAASLNRIAEAGCSCEYAAGHSAKFLFYLVPPLAAVALVYLIICIVRQVLERRSKAASEPDANASA